MGLGCSSVDRIIFLMCEMKTHNRRADLFVRTSFLHVFWCLFNHQYIYKSSQTHVCVYHVSYKYHCRLTGTIMECKWIVRWWLMSLPFLEVLIVSHEFFFHVWICFFKIAIQKKINSLELKHAETDQYLWNELSIVNLSTNRDN